MRPHILDFIYPKNVAVSDADKKKISLRRHRLYVVRTVVKRLMRLTFFALKMKFPRNIHIFTRKCAIGVDLYLYIKRYYSRFHMRKVYVLLYAIVHFFLVYNWEHIFLVFLLFFFSKESKVCFRTDMFILWANFILLKPTLKFEWLICVCVTMKDSSPNVMSCKIVSWNYMRINERLPLLFNCFKMFFFSFFDVFF